MVSVPVKSKIPSLKKPCSQKREVEQIIASATTVIDQILRMTDVMEKHKKEMLSDMIWKISESNGRWNTRYYSAGVLDKTNDEKVQHEHVVTRKEIIDQLLKKPNEYKEILKQVTACIVTESEHLKLGQAKNSSGLDRYKQAEVKVFDRLDGKWLL